MSPPSPLFMDHQAEESQTLFQWLIYMATGTELMPNPVAVHSERAAGKPKKREGLWKPKSEPVPNRTSEPAIGGASISRMLGSWGTKLCHSG